MSILSDLRIDIGDDSNAIGSVSGVPNLLSHLQVDIGNDRQVITSNNGTTNVGNIIINGYMAVTPITVNSSYSIPNGTNSYVMVNNTSGFPISITLPPNPVNGQIEVIKDVGGNASVYNITVNPFSGTIDGLASFIMTSNYQSVTFYYNGSFWSII